MGHYGRKKIKFGGETGSVKTMSFEVTDVTKPLVAVRRIMEKRQGGPLREGVLHQERPHWRKDSNEKERWIVRH